MHCLLKTMNEEPISNISPLTDNNTNNTMLTERCRQRLRSMHVNSYDREQGGLQSPIKFIDRDSIEYSMLLAADNDQSEANIAIKTLDNAMALLDQEWGGVYQYSTQSRWDLPHHRKTMATQAATLRLYSLAYALFNQTRYLAVAQSIRNYIENFLTSKNGAFYCGQSDTVPGINARLYFSMSAKDRQKFGIPEIDKRITSRENGWAIEALAACYEYTGDEAALNMVITAGQIMIRNCQAANGGWRVSLIAEQGEQLAENLAMARAMLQLYRVTLKKPYLDHAERTLDYINRHFRDPVAGFDSHTFKSGKSSPRQIDENISLGRFANLMYHYTSKQRYKNIAIHAFRYLSIFEIATCRMEDAGILLFERELNASPITFTIETNYTRQEINPFLSCVYRYRGWYKLIEWQHSEQERIVVTIDGIRSRPLYTTEHLQDLLHMSH